MPTFGLMYSLSQGNCGNNYIETTLVTQNVSNTIIKTVQDKTVVVVVVVLFL